MKLVRRHPLFFLCLAVIVIGIGAEAWFFSSLRRQERVLETQLNQKIAEIERLQRQRPGPTDENLRRAREDFAQHAEVLATMLRSLNVSGPDELEYFAGEPADRTEACFEILEFIEQMTRISADARVLVRPEEKFGFSAYVNEGPDPEIIRPVHRQRRIVEYLLTSLFAAGPRTLVSVQREDPRTIVRSEGRTAGTGPSAPAPAPAPAARPASTASTFAGGGGARADSAAASEIFVIDPQVSARTPGYVDTMAVRIVFTGQTSSLRGLMNSLAAPEIPLVVRSVEVEPLRAESTAGSARTPARPADAAAPVSDLAIVGDNESRFTVTVELFEVKLRAPEVPAAAPRP
ncbi:MAG: hypothetical protein IAE82_21865 [Opitutaceae bacterium]|nr:hypothetical protein [Opitutaceae bacterium]